MDADAFYQPGIADSYPEAHNPSPNALPWQHSTLAHNPSAIAMPWQHSPLAHNPSAIAMPWQYSTSSAIAMPWLHPILAHNPSAIAMPWQQTSSVLDSANPPTNLMSPIEYSMDAETFVDVR